jgi:hypothetical protein
MAIVGESLVTGAVRKLFDGITRRAAGTGDEIMSIAGDGITRSADLSSAVLNRAVGLQREIAELSADIDAKVTKLDAVTALVRQADDTTWWVNTWNDTVRHEGKDSQLKFLHRRWNQDQGVLWSLEYVVKEPVSVKPIPDALPLMTDRDVVLSEGAIKGLVTRLRDMQEARAELTTRSALISNQLDDAARIVGQWKSSDSWFVNEWNNTARHRDHSYQYTRHREIWDNADGYRRSLKQLLGL